MLQEEFLKDLYFDTLKKEINNEDFSSELIFSGKKVFLGFEIYFGYNEYLGFFSFIKNKYNEEHIFFLFDIIYQENFSKLKEKLFFSNIKGIDSLNDFFDLNGLRIISKEELDSPDLRKTYWQNLPKEPSFENFLKAAFSSWRINNQSISKIISYFIINKLAKGQKEFTYSNVDELVQIHFNKLLKLINSIWGRSRDKDVFSFGKNFVIALILFRVEKDNLLKYINVDYDLYYELLEKKFLEYEESFPEDSQYRKELRGFSSDEEYYEHIEQSQRLEEEFYAKTIQEYIDNADIYEYDSNENK